MNVRLDKKEMSETATFFLLFLLNAISSYDISPTIFILIPKISTIVFSRNAVKKYLITPLKCISTFK